MQDSTKLRLSRVVCDLLAVGVGYFCLVGFLGVDNFSGWAIAFALIPFCGMIAGLGFGFSQRPSSRLVCAVAAVVMCLACVVVQCKMYVLGRSDVVSVAFHLCCSLPCALLLICVLADRRLGKQIGSQVRLPLMMRLSRGATGCWTVYLLLSIAVCVYVLPTRESPVQVTLIAYALISNVCWFGFSGMLFWHMTHPGVRLVDKSEDVSSFKESWRIWQTILKFLLSALTCSATAWLADKTGADESLALTTAIVVWILAAIAMIFRHGFKISDDPASKTACA